MSILKSTNSGTFGEKFCFEYLIEHPEITKKEPKYFNNYKSYTRWNFFIDKHEFIYLKDEGFFTIIYLFRYQYKFHIETVGDFNEVMKYWRIKKKNPCLCSDSEILLLSNLCKSVKYEINKYV